MWSRSFAPAACHPVSRQPPHRSVLPMSALRFRQWQNGRCPPYETSLPCCAKTIRSSADAQKQSTAGSGGCWRCPSPRRGGRLAAGPQNLTASWTLQDTASRGRPVYGRTRGLRAGKEDSQRLRHARADAPGCDPLPSSSVIIIVITIVVVVDIAIASVSIVVIVIVIVIVIIIIIIIIIVALVPTGPTVLTVLIFIIVFIVFIVLTTTTITTITAITVTMAVRAHLMTSATSFHSGLWHSAGISSLT